MNNFQQELVAKSTSCAELYNVRTIVTLNILEVLTYIIYIKNENFRAHKGDGSGSAYLQAFSTYLDRHYMNHDLDTIHSMVNRYMASVEHVSHRSSSSAKESQHFNNILFK